MKYQKIIAFLRVIWFGGFLLTQAQYVEVREKNQLKKFLI